MGSKPRPGLGPPKEGQTPKLFLLLTLQLDRKRGKGRFTQGTRTDLRIRILNPGSRRNLNPNALNSDLRSTVTSAESLRGTYA